MQNSSSSSKPPDSSPMTPTPQSIFKAISINALNVLSIHSSNSILASTRKALTLLSYLKSLILQIPNFTPKLATIGSQLSILKIKMIHLQILKMASSKPLSVSPHSLVESKAPIQDPKVFCKTTSIPTREARASGSKTNTSWGTKLPDWGDNYGWHQLQAIIGNDCELWHILQILRCYDGSLSFGCQP